MGAILGSLTGPLLGLVVQPVLKKNTWWEKTVLTLICLSKHLVEKTYNAAEDAATKWTVVSGKVQESEHEKPPEKHDNSKDKRNCA